jgi:hypothetical protein
MAHGMRTDVEGRGKREVASVLGRSVSAAVMNSLFFVEH